MIKSKIKNIGPYLTFDEKWFRKNQRTLIWLLNAPVIKIWFRWILRIRKYDCHLNEKINLILPNQFHRNARIVGDKIYATADFRTHWKFSKRIYHAFSLVWWMLHFWDWLVADRFLPELSFGLFTLTKSPDSGTGQVTCDGSIYVYNREMSSVELLSENTTGTYNSYVQTISQEFQFATVGCNSTPINTFNGLTKSFFFFDTSSLGAVTLYSAKLSLYVSRYSGITSMGFGKMGLYSANGTTYNNTLITTDYFNVGIISLSNDMIVETITSGNIYALKIPRYYEYILNSNGISNINKTGISKFAVRFTFDSFGWVEGQGHHLTGYFADYDGTSFDPKLVVEYSIPSTNKIQMII